MARILGGLGVGAALVVVALIAVLAAIVGLDRPQPPPPMVSVSDPFQAVDFSDLPKLLHVTARDGLALAYRRYDGDPDRLVVLIHGSAGSSTSMHALAKALQAAGASVIAPDMRGHGGSGPHGDIAYTGQLEDDLQDLMTALDRVHQARQTTLIGFSSGGGFALRVAGGPLGGLFSRTMLLAPFLRHDAPNARPSTGTGTGSGGWVDVAVPRLVALSLLDRAGITAFDGLPVLAFGVAAGNPAHLTTTYSYRLLMNFAPDDDYQADLRRVSQPLMAMAGADDEIFVSNRLQAALDAGRPGTRVDIVPGVGHIGLITTPAATVSVARAWAGHWQ